MYIVNKPHEITSEILGVSFTLNNDEIKKISGNIVLNEEESWYYASIFTELEKVYKKEIQEDGYTRKIVYSGVECITSISLYKRDEICKLCVYMRSSDTRKLPSDLGFLCRVALHYSADEITILIGSYHTVLYRENETTINL